MLVAVLSCTGASASARADWEMAKGPLKTRWARSVKPDKVLPEYPRPQLVRPQWTNLNGLWKYAITPRAAEKPAEWKEEILVPFPVESALSGVMKPVDEKSRLWYRRTFAAPLAGPKQRVLLHFGAVDWEATVWVNGKQVAQHTGGYDPFSCDISEALHTTGEQELVVAVWDPTDTGTQPRGKQVLHPGGIMYTPTTGIWQTVWLEIVPDIYVADLLITPDIDKHEVRIQCFLAGELREAKVWARVYEGDREVGFADAKATSPVMTIPIHDPRLWSPDDPFLYRIKLGLSNTGSVADEIESYVGMRKISLGKDAAGITRMMLNNEFVFQHGPLDQGFWPEGLYTAPTDEALRYDIEITKRLGFNMARKHVKVEPERWYYWCDKLGLLVWQDMPSGDRGIGGNDPDLQRSPESARQYEKELQAMIETHRNHPSIVMWVPFNEGWGQFDTVRITQWVEKFDPTRLADCASGWSDRPAGAVHDIHSYPGPASPQPEEHRAAVLGEYGGLGLPLKNHTWQSDKNWGYQSFQDLETLNKNLLQCVGRLRPLINSPGLSAAVYTQTTDVEIEVNGLMTYDRVFIKPKVEELCEANRQLRLRPQVVKPLLPTSELQARTWRWTTDKPKDEWFDPEFDDSDWASGPGGFGTAETPGAVVRTEWKTPDIWARQTFELKDPLKGEIALRIHHDEDAQVYINHTLMSEPGGYTRQYESLPLSTNAAGWLRKGKNVIAVHCHQTTGGQYIDVGIDEITPPSQTEDIRLAPGSLFDGKSLRNWQPSPFGGHGEVTVQDGQIIMKYGEPMTGISWTGPLSRINYQLDLDAQRVDGTDFFCGLTFPIGDDPCSFIVGGWGGGVVGLSSLDGHDASDNETTKFMEFTKGRWYHIRLTVTKEKVQAWIDDQQVVDVALAGKKISIRHEVEMSRPLGIACYNTTAALKKIFIHELDSDSGEKKKTESKVEAKK